MKLLKYVLFPAGCFLGDPFASQSHGSSRHGGELLTWITCGGGRLAIGHRPSRRRIAELPRLGATSVFTILSEAENALEIRAECQKAGLRWYWLPLASADLPERSRFAEIIQTFRLLEQGFADGQSIYAHCSAGIHRTGMIVFALLRFLGVTAEDATRDLRTLRAIASEQVGRKRLLWAETLLAAGLSTTSCD
jgi:protein-tyrosine phosphatase